MYIQEKRLPRMYCVYLVISTAQWKMEVIFQQGEIQVLKMKVKPLRCVLFLSCTSFVIVGLLKCFPFAVLCSPSNTAPFLSKCPVVWHMMPLVTMCWGGVKEGMLDYWNTRESACFAFWLGNMACDLFGQVFFFFFKSHKSLNCLFCVSLYTCPPFSKQGFAIFFYHFSHFGKRIWSWIYNYSTVCFPCTVVSLWDSCLFFFCFVFFYKLTIAATK